MNNNLLQIKIKQRLNKLASFDYDNLECWMVQEAFNKAQIEWTRRQLYGMNLRKEGAEQSSGLIDDLQQLLVQTEMRGTDRNKFFESDLLPDNYLHFVRVDVKAKAECCPERELTVYETEEANVGVLLRDSNREPSFEWAETFVTLLGNRLRVYTNEKFEVTDVQLVYYRLPREVQFSGCTNAATGSVFTANQTCEFTDDICEILVDEAAAVLAGDIESMNQYQREIQNAQRNS
jgi:hypothetical protein